MVTSFVALFHFFDFLEVNFFLVYLFCESTFFRLRHFPVCLKLNALGVASLSGQELAEALGRKENRVGICVS